MSGDKRISNKRASRKGAVAALGVAGALSLSGACSASASTSPTGGAQQSTRVLLAEEEISDVSLSTFYVFDRENSLRGGVQFAAGKGCAAGPGHGCGGAGRGC